jgi:hypothetical protein
MPAALAAANANLDNELDAAKDFDRSLGVEWTYQHGWPNEVTYGLKFVGCNGCTPPDDGTPGFGGSGLPPMDDGWGSDDVGPPPTGPNAVPTDYDQQPIADDGEPSYGSASDNAAGCSAGGGVSGGATLVLMGLALGCLGRRGRGARAARRGTR